MLHELVGLTVGTIEEEVLEGATAAQYVEAGTGGSTSSNVPHQDSADSGMPSDICSLNEQVGLCT